MCDRVRSAGDARYVAATVSEDTSAEGETRLALHSAAGFLIRSPGGYAPGLCAPRSRGLFRPHLASIMITQARESVGSRPCPSAVIAKASALKRLPFSKLRSMRPGMPWSQAVWTAIHRQPELLWQRRLFISHRKAKQILSGSKSWPWRPSRGRSPNKRARRPKPTPF